MTKKQIEDKLIELFEREQNEGGIFEDVEWVRRFDGVLATNDNGVVIDLADGTQFSLTIQTR